MRFFKPLVKKFFVAPDENKKKMIRMFAREFEIPRRRRKGPRVKGTWSVPLKSSPPPSPATRCDGNGERDKRTKGKKRSSSSSVGLLKKKGELKTPKEQRVLEE